MNQIEKFRKVRINISDIDFFFVAKEAHKLDITFNQMFNKIILEQLDKLEKELSAGGKPTKRIQSKPSTIKPLPSKTRASRMASVPNRILKSKRT